MVYDPDNQHSLLELLRHSLSKNGATVAVESTTGTVTYGDLDLWTDAVAAEIKLHTTTSILGIIQERSIEQVVGVIGALKAGFAFLPIDPRNPLKRNRLQLEMASVRLVVTTRQCLEKYPALFEGMSVILCDQREVRLAAPHDHGFAEYDDNCLAYVIFTSGTTGTPKGVMVSSRSVKNLADSLWIEIYSRFGARSVKISLNAPFTFDVFIQQFIALLFGHTLVVIPEDIRADGQQLVEFLRTLEVCVLDCVPTQLDLMIEGGLLLHGATRVEVVLVGGEPIGQNTWRYLQNSTFIEFFNLYGPTECTVDSLICKIDFTVSTPAIGRPLRNVFLSVVNSELLPVTAGEVGELLIGGVGVAEGYASDPNLTSLKFITFSHSDASHLKWYRTGDSVRLNKDGLYEFIGRLDQQVKIRGHRVELDEIDAVLGAHDQILRAVTLLVDVGTEQTLFTAIIKKPTSRMSEDNIKDFLRLSLPSYMVPTNIRFVRSIPVSDNGKADRRRLSEMLNLPVEISEDLQGLGLSRIEAVVLETWGRALNRSNIDKTTNFYLAGGHSLSAARIVADLRHILGIRINLGDLFKTPVAGDFTRLVEAKVSSQEQVTPLTTAIATNASETGPASYQQEGVWLVEKLYPGCLAYCFQSVLTFEGKLSVANLRRALAMVSQVHPAFRTTFWDDSRGNVFQTVHDEISIDFQFEDLAAMGVVDSKTFHVFDKYIEKPIDMSRLPLVHWVLVKVAEDKHLLLHREHHIIHDGLSFNLFLQQLLRVYSELQLGQIPTLDSPKTTYLEFAQWQRRFVETEESNETLRYWKRILGDVDLETELPTDFSRSAVKQFSGDCHRITIDMSLAIRLRDYAKKSNTTLFAVMISAFQILIARYIGSNTFVLGTAVAGRTTHQTNDVVGMFVNNLPIKAHINGNLGFDQFVQIVAQDFATSLDHQDVPFTYLFRQLASRSTLAKSPIFQIMFSFHDSPLPNLSVPGARVGIHEGLANKTSKYDLDVTVIPRSEDGQNSEGITLIWDYSTALFDAQTMFLMTENYLMLLSNLLEDPTLPIWRIDASSEAEKEILAELACPIGIPSASLSICDRFEEQVSCKPSQLAIVDGTKNVTYSDLGDEVQKVALLLMNNHVKHGLGICARKSAGLFAAILGAWKIEVYTVILDPSIPKGRISNMIQDSGISSVLVHESFQSLIDGQIVQTIKLQGQSYHLIVYSSVQDLMGELGRGLAYVNYTSGSTGRPKGVMVTHDNVLNTLGSWNEIFGLDQKSGVHLQIASPSFDVFLGDLVRSLSFGHTLVVCPKEVALEPKELLDLMRGSNVTFAEFTPAVLRNLMEYLESNCSDISFMDTVICGSDVWSTEDFNRLISYCGENTKILNTYGLTETTIDSFYFEPKLVRNLSPNRSLPIGKPLPNSGARILGERGSNVPIGAIGELCIWGESVARGYTNSAIIEGANFVGDPSDLSGRMFRTGDLGRLRPGVGVEIVGRRDRQIKIRGFRIELGEVEAALMSHKSVAQAVVGVRGISDESRVLVAKVVLKTGVEIKTNELKGYLRRFLPEYMVPMAILIVDEIGVSLSGKLLREFETEIEEGPAQPTNQPVESVLEVFTTSVFCDVLQSKKVGLDENFFDRGGHSLMAARLIAIIRSELGVSVPLEELFLNPTIKSFTKTVQRIGSQYSLTQKLEMMNRGQLLDTLRSLINLGDQELESKLNKMELL